MPDVLRRERPDRARVAPVRSTRTAGARAPRRTSVAGRPTPAHARTVAGRRPKRTATRAVPPSRARPAPAPAPAPPKRRAASPAVRRRRSRLASLVFAVLFLGFVVAFVYPTRTYLRQRSELSAAEQRLEVLERETRTLEQESARLETDAEIERVAREQYGLVRPGEVPYVLVPETSAPQPAG